MSSKIPNVKKECSRTNFQLLSTTDPEEHDKSFKDGDTACGIGSFRPEWMQTLKTTKLFLLNHSILGILQGALFAYLVGCLSTLEKRYAYESKVSGVIMISDEISPILFGMLLGYFGGKSHRPRVVAFGMVISVLSCFIMTCPYFIYGAIIKQNNGNLMLPSNETKEEYCDMNKKNYSCTKSPTITAVSFLFFGTFLKGFGSLAFYTIGTSYLDDSVKKKNSPVYLSTLFALRLFGPVIGLLLSSICLQFYEDPFYDPGFGTKDPRWVGAWWLGFIILGILIFIFSIPMILFPKSFRKKIMPKDFQKRKEEAPKSTTEQLKDMGKAIARLGKNPLLVSHYLGSLLRLNGVAGYFVLLPKYMEIQFRQSASKASLYSGPASLIATQIGFLLGGIVIRKFRPRPRVMTGGIIIAETFSIIAFIICMTITCPVNQITGTSSVSNSLLHLENECNSHCMCTTKVFTPVCGPDGLSSYFSPCYAGCSGVNTAGEKGFYTDCKCVYNEAGEFIIGDASKSYCSFECQWIITFIVVLCLGKLLSSTARASNALVILRSVDPEDKSIALGALAGIYSLLALIPSSLIYGALADASCLVWEESCGKSGNCWIYDADKFRYLLHGVSAGFVFLAGLTDVLVWYFSPRLNNLYDEDDEDKEDADINEADVINSGGMLGGLKIGLESVSLKSLDEKLTTTF